MNKKLVLLGIVIITILIYGCDIPEKVIIKGTPELSFSTDMNLGDVLDISPDSIAGSNNNNITVLDCTHGTIVVKTFAIHNFIDDINFNIANPAPDSGQTNIQIEVNGDMIYVDNSHNDFVKFNEPYDNFDTEPETISFSDFGNIDELEGFIFSSENVKTYLYLSGTNIVRKLELDIEIDGEAIPQIKDRVPASSGINLNQNTFNSPALPGGGIPLQIDIADYINKERDMTIEYQIVIPAGAEISREWLTEGENAGHDIIVELVIWLPLELKANGNKTVQGIHGKGAELTFPSDFFDGVNDFLESIFDISESLSMEIGLSNEHPFNDAYMVIDNYSMLPVINRLSGNKIVFNFNDDQINQIENYGFNPAFRIFFTNGSEFSIPKDFELKIISVEFKASLFVEL